MLKAPSSSSPTPDAEKTEPVQEQMTSESEEPFSDQDVDHQQLSFEEE